MRFNTKTFISSFQHYLTKFVSGLLMLTLFWQASLWGGQAAIASPLLATSTSSISKQVSGKAEEMKGSAKQKIGKAQSTMEDKARAAKMKVKDDLTEAKIAVDGNTVRVENAGEKAATAVKDFFGQ
jgi:uncharacterized protein YjbJ (UPF0337 family)